MLAARAGRAARAKFDLVKADNDSAGGVQGIAHGRDCGDADLKTAAWEADGVTVIPPRTLAEVFDELAEVSLDPSAVLERTAVRCAELVGDGCLIRLISEDGTTLEPAAYGHREPERRAFAEQSLRGRAQRVGEGISGTGRRDGPGDVHPGRSDGRRVHRRAPAPVPGALRRAFRDRAAPMHARGRVVGVMLVGREGESEPLSEDDAETVIRLADRAALMFDNARLFGALDRQLAEHQRADERIRFQAGLLEQIDTAVVALDDERRCTEFNPAAERLFGYSRDEVAGRRLVKLLAAPGQDALVAELREVVPHGGWEGESRMVRKDGSQFPAHVRIAPIRDASGHHLGIVCVFQDVTERKTVEERLTKRAAEQAAVAALGERALEGGPLPALLDHAMEVVAEVLGIEFADVLELAEDERSFLLKSGVGFREGLVRNITVSADWADSQAGFTMLAKEPVVVEDIAGEHRFQAGNLLGDHEVASGMTVIVQGRGKPYGVVGAYSRERRAFTPEDVSFLQAVANVLADAIDRVQTEEETRRRGLHDPLTGLPNRTLVLDRIAHALARADRGEASVAVLFLDVDNFKVVNDSLGHRAGDNLLRQLAARLERRRPAGRHGRALRRRRVRRALRGRHRRADGAADRRAARARVRRAVLARGRRRPRRLGVDRRGACATGRRTTPRSSCATLMPPCTAPRSVAARGSSCSTPACARGRSGACRPRATCAARWNATSCGSSTSRSSRSATARSAASRRWCAGSTPSAGCSRRRSSSPSPRRAG